MQLLKKNIDFQIFFIPRNKIENYDVTIYLVNENTNQKQTINATIYETQSEIHFLLLPIYPNGKENSKLYFEIKDGQLILSVGKIMLVSATGYNQTNKFY